MLYIGKESMDIYSFWSKKPKWSSRWRQFVDSQGEKVFRKVFCASYVRSACSDYVNNILKAAGTRMKVGELRKIKFIK